MAADWLPDLPPGYRWKLNPDRSDPRWGWIGLERKRPWGWSRLDSEYVICDDDERSRTKMHAKALTMIASRLGVLADTPAGRMAKEVNS